MTHSLAVIDISSGGNVISCIRNTKNSFDANDLIDITHRFEDKLNKLLFSYESRPILLCDKENIAVVVPSFTASTGMYILAVPNVSARAVSFALRSGMVDDALILGEFAEYTRVSKRMREEAKILRKWIDELCLCFFPPNENESAVFDEFLRSRISSISEHVGVYARIVNVGSVRETENFDLGLFSAFVTVMLILARKYSRDGAALVSIGKNTVCLSALIFLLTAKTRVTIWECLSLREWLTERESFLRLLRKMMGYR